MNPMQDNGVVAMGHRLTAAGTGGVLSFDTKGYDYANVYILGYNASAASSGCVSSVILSESDTVTSATSQTDIVAFTGGTVTSATVGFVIGGDTTNTGQTGVIELNVDLKKRKRYLGLQVTADQGATNFVSAVAILVPDQSKTTTTVAAVTNSQNTMASLVNRVTG